MLVTPKKLLVGTTNKTLARELFDETKVMVTTTADKRRFASNPHEGNFEPVISPYLNNTNITNRLGKAITGQSGTQWYLLAEDNAAYEEESRTRKR